MSIDLKNIKFIVQFLFFAGIIFSCQKIYDPDNLDASERIPVITGYIDNSSAVSNVLLEWASPFGDKSPEPIYDARVSILDDEGNEDVLVQAIGGTYISSNNMQGVPGRKYHVRVELGDGTIFESEPVIMPSHPQLDSVYAHMTKNDKVEKNQYGDLIIKTFDGLEVAYDVSSSDNNKGYYRFESTVISQTRHTITNTPLPITVYCWTYRGLNSTISINSTLQEKGDNIVKNHKVGFMPYVFDLNTRTDSTTPKLPVGWIVTTRIFSIGEDSYLYYDQLVDQLEAENRIFDPIPSQITSNLKCITDTTKLVLGNFEVASVLEKTTGFKWSPGYDHYWIKDLPDFKGTRVDNCVDSVRPEWWLEF